MAQEHKRRRIRSTDIAVQEEIGRLALKRPPLTAAAIYQELLSLAHGKDPPFAVQVVPSLKTVQNIVADVRPLDDSGVWSIVTIATADAGDIALVVPVLAAAAAEYGVGVTITIAEAGIITRIVRAAPDMPPLDVYHLTRAYLRRGDEPTHDLDVFLAVGPWRDDETARRYYAAGGEITRLGGMFGRLGHAPTVTVTTRPAPKRTSRKKGRTK